MAEPLDDLDIAIMRELQDDGRQSNVSLAKKVNLTEGAVRRRLERLLQSGVFRIGAVGDPTLLGLHAHAILAIRCELSEASDFAERLAAMPELSYVYEVTGAYDVMAVGFFESNETLHKFRTTKLAHEPGIVACDTFMVISTAKRSFRWGEHLRTESESTG